MDSLERKRKRNRVYMRLWAQDNREEARKRANEQYQKIKADPSTSLIYWI